MAPPTLSDHDRSRYRRDRNLDRESQTRLARDVRPEKGEDPEKYTKGLGLNASSFPDSYEDIVTMGANAAHRLMERKGLEPDDIGRIDVATESSFDNSKPVSTYVAGCLEGLRRRLPPREQR